MKAEIYTLLSAGTLQFLSNFVIRPWELVISYKFHLNSYFESANKVREMNSTKHFLLFLNNLNI